MEVHCRQVLSSERCVTVHLLALIAPLQLTVLSVKDGGGDHCPYAPAPRDKASTWLASLVQVEVEDNREDQAFQWASVRTNTKTVDPPSPISYLC